MFPFDFSLSFHKSKFNRSKFLLHKATIRPQKSEKVSVKRVEIKLWHLADLYGLDSPPLDLSPFALPTLSYTRGGARTFVHLLSNHACLQTFM